MILADKIIELRKQNNWSQEELAEKLGVSRQAISKWEGAQSTPDLERILAMSNLFGVSTDYLVKDEIESKLIPEEAEESGSSLRRLSMEEANAFINAKLKSAKPIAFGVWLCIMAAIPPILSAIWRKQFFAEPLGLIVAAFIVAGAVALFLLKGFKLKDFEWMDKEPFETAYGIDGMVKERLQSFMPKYVVHIVIGVVLCIVAMATFVASDFLPKLIQVEGNAVIAVGIAIVAIAVYLFVSAGIVRGTYSRLLQEDDYHPDKKILGKKIGPIIGVYWLVATAIYLAYSFITLDWQRSWIIWPVAGILFGVFYIILELIFGKKEK
ncbi:MAG TPA: helix-turn-helix transcriptional regulator [Clostridiales bacterium]|nr:helix-turn-helix transcriptional regulator [Clostridiales bacterium]